MSNIKIFDNFSKRTAGVWYFVPKDLAAYKKGKPCHGFGCVKYGEGSVYTGDLYFDGKNYNKIGKGQQEFTESSLGMYDPFMKGKKYLFVGKYDYRKTDWIYGDGVLYYKDVEGNPLTFIKGFFMGLDVFKPYSKEFDYSQLLPGYTKEMECDYNANPRRCLFEGEKLNYKDIVEFENLFLGDSYFEFWYYDKFAGPTFKNTFDPKKSLNVGLGGTKFIDWYEYIPLLADLKEPKNIIVNLGFNDLHSNYSAVKVYRDFKKFLRMFKEIFPNSNYYILNVVHGPNFVEKYNEENKLNDMMERLSKKNGVTIIHNSEVIEKEQANINCFDEDGCHLNPHGYLIMKAEIDKALK